MRTLSELRETKNLSQKELAQELCEIGMTISPASIAMYELGERQPSLRKAKTIAHYFGVPTDDIFFGPRAHLERANNNNAHNLDSTGTEGRR